MFPYIRLEAAPGQVDVARIVADLRSGKSGELTFECEQLTHSVCRQNAQCGDCPVAIGDQEHLRNTLQEIGFTPSKRFPRIRSSDGTKILTDIVGPEGRGLVRISHTRVTLREGEERPWLQSPAKEGDLSGKLTIYWNGKYTDFP